jgi:hypothetical protein
MKVLIACELGRERRLDNGQPELGGTMKTLYLYQLEDGESFTSEDEPAQNDRDCASAGILRIFRICVEEPYGVITIEELACSQSILLNEVVQNWTKLLGSCLKTNADISDDDDITPYHVPLKE